MPIVEVCRRREIAFVPFFPLGSAFTGGPRSSPRTPRSPRSPPSMTRRPSQVALAWLLDRYERILLIPGTTSVAHLEENMAAAEVVLDEEDQVTLAAVQQHGDPLH